MNEVVHDEVQSERERLPRRLLVTVVVATLVIGVALAGLTLLLMRAAQREVRPSLAFPERDLPAPGETSNVRQELFGVAVPRATRAEEQRRRLEGFGWVDRGRRLVHIPIEDAIEIVAGQGGRPSR